MSNIQFIQTTPEQLKEQIAESIKEQLKQFVKENSEKPIEEYLTRNEVAKLLKVDLSTIHNWCRKGKLKPYGIGARVYFLKSDIDNCLTPLNNL